jgi:hypothetical protein
MENIGIFYFHLVKYGALGMENIGIFGPFGIVCGPWVYFLVC